MKDFYRSIAIVLVTALVTQPMLAWAGPATRVVPTQRVTVLEGEKEIRQFQSEMPLPEGLLLGCKGSCLVHNNGLQLIAHDQAVFALSEADGQWDLSVKSGQVEFAVRSDSKPLAFYTPHDQVQPKRSILPADSKGVVRGTISVTESASQLAIQEGGLQVETHRGEQVIQSGQAIVLAQAQMRPLPIPMRPLPERPPAQVEPQAPTPPAQQKAKPAKSEPIKLVRTGEFDNVTDNATVPLLTAGGSCCLLLAQMTFAGAGTIGERRQSAAKSTTSVQPKAPTIPPANQAMEPVELARTGEFDNVTDGVGVFLPGSETECCLTLAGAGVLAIGGFTLLADNIFGDEDDEDREVSPF